MAKKLSRREFLLRSGAGVAAISLAACAAPVPAAPQAKEEAQAAEAKPAAAEVVKIVWGTPWGGNPPFIQKNMETLMLGAFKKVPGAIVPASGKKA